MAERTDDELLTAFAEASLQGHEWTHRTHVLVAYTHLRRHSFEEACALVSQGLRRQLERLEVPEELESGYHETLTMTWMRLIHSAMIAHGPCEDFAAFAAEHPYLLVRKLIRALYTREQLCTWPAKRTFVQPNLLRFAEQPLKGSEGDDDG